MNASIIAAMGVGFALGLKHALDADHLAAVAVMVSGRRRSISGASLVGVIWGVGHAAALTTVGFAVVLLGVRVPIRLASLMEAAVGVVLVVMGGRLLLTMRRGTVLHAHAHIHGWRLHFHPHLHPHGTGREDPAHHPLGARAERIVASAGPRMNPFLVGLLHGTAGSAALMLVIVTTLETTGARLAYVLLFGLGSVAGMACMSALVGIPFLIGGPLEGRTRAGLRLAAGGISVALGLSMLWRFAPGL